MAEQGYTGRKLLNYVWIPKSKTDLREYREFLKICNDVEGSSGYFNDRTIGEAMVARRAIVDRDSTSESYITKYSGKTIGDQSYVSNARMLIRICRWLGWITKTEEDAKFILTPYGKTLTLFEGSFPARIQSLDEYQLVSEAFSMFKFYSVNDSIKFRNPQFKQRVFLNMLRVLASFEYCSHYELVVSAFVLKDERNQKEFEERLDVVRKLKRGDISIGEALNDLGLDSKNKSSVTGIYDGPKVLLSFARQLGLVENVEVGPANPKVFSVYKKMYRDSGYIHPAGIKSVSRLTKQGEEYLKKYLHKQVIWFDELRDATDEATLLIYLNKIKEISTREIDKHKFMPAVKILMAGGILAEREGKLYLRVDTDFDLFFDVPYEARPRVIEKLTELKSDFLGMYDMIVDKKTVDELFVNVSKFKRGQCVFCAEPRCAMYPEYSKLYGASDRFSTRVCPVDAVKLMEGGKVIINDQACVGCTLCALRCPFGAISLKNNKASISYSEAYVHLPYTEKLKQTERLIAKEGQLPTLSLTEARPIIRNFEARITIPGKEWKKDAFYVYVRNILRSFGLEVVYSGSGGMKTRSDVTVTKPFVITSEVKSPAEGPINLKAIRQAFQAALQKETLLTLAVGVTTHKGAIEEEPRFRKASKVMILLIEIKYLVYLMLIKDYLGITPDSIKRLVENNPGYFDKAKLVSFIKFESTLNNITPKITSELIQNAEALF